MKKQKYDSKKKKIKKMMLQIFMPLMQLLQLLEKQKKKRQQENLKLIQNILKNKNLMEIRKQLYSSKVNFYRKLQQGKQVLLYLDHQVNNLLILVIVENSTTVYDNINNPDRPIMTRNSIQTSLKVK